MEPRWRGSQPVGQGRSHWAALPQARMLFPPSISPCLWFLSRLSSYFCHLVSCVLPSSPPPRSVHLSLSSLGTLIPTGAALKARRSFPFVCPHRLPARGPTGHVRTAQSRREGRLPLEGEAEQPRPSEAHSCHSVTSSAKNSFFLVLTCFCWRLLRPARGGGWAWWGWWRGDAGGR